MGRQLGGCTWLYISQKSSIVATVDILTWFSFHERFLSPAEYQRVQGLRSGVRGMEGMDTVDRNGQMDIFLLSFSLLGGMVERADRNGQMASFLLSSSCSSNLTFFLFRSFFITLPLDRSSALVILLSVGSIANWQLKTAQGEIQRNLPRKQILFGKCKCKLLAERPLESQLYPGLRDPGSYIY